MAAPPRTFLGRGWVFPPRFHGSTGTVAMVSDLDDIHQALEILLRTLQGERRMHPDFGLHIEVFASVSQSTLAELATRIENTIIRYEPRVKVRDIEIDTERGETGEIRVTIRYDVPAINARANLVFPFYLAEGAAFDPLVSLPGTTARGSEPGA